MRSRWWLPSTQTARTASGVVRNRSTGTRYFSHPSRTLPRARPCQASASSVSAHSFMRGKADSATAPPPASGTTPVTSSASIA